MKKILAKASFGFCGANYVDEFEFDDYYTNEEIEKEISEWANQFVEIEWEEINEEEDNND